VGALDGTRISSRSDFLVYVKALARLFRGKMLGCAQAWAEGYPAK
jgi:hypothetical protein